MPIPELELLGWTVELLKAGNITGLNPNTGNSRTVAIYNQVKQDAFVPYIRVGFTDTLNLEDEPFGYSFTPTVKTIHQMVDVFSDYEPEMLQIASQIQVLIQHEEVTTTNYQGSTWLNSVDYFVENTGSPDRILRRASVRLEARIEPK